MEFAPLVENPWLWIYLFGLLLGAAGGSLRRIRRRRRNPVTVMSLLAAASFASLSLGLVSAPGILTTHGLLWGFLAALAIGLLLGLFPVPVISLLFVVVVLVYSAIGIRVHMLNERDISIEPLSISVLRLFNEGGGSIEVRHKGRTTILRLAADKFRVEGTVHSVLSYIPWPGSNLVIPERIRALDGTNGVHLLHPEATAGGDSWLLTAAQWLSRLPLIGTEEWFSPEIRMRLFTDYKITGEDGKNQTAPLSFQSEKSDTGE